jgi:hypothetical protein
MNEGYYDKKQLSPSKTVYYFDGLLDYLRFSNELEPKLIGNAKRGWDSQKGEQNVRAQSMQTWFGTRDAQSVLGQKTSFLFNDQLNNFINNIRDTAINTDIIDIDQQKKIEFTERELGIFSFDLASLGLVRVYEYFSPLLNKVVDNDYIRSVNVEDGKTLFYHVKVNFSPKHIVKYNNAMGGYYSKILQKVVEFSDLEVEVTEDDILNYYPEIAEIPEHYVERVQKKNEDGSLKFGTTFKKCFVHIPKSKSSLPRIDLIISASYAYDTNAQTQMIWNTMAGLAVAEKLSKSNVNYRIIAAYPVETNGAGNPKQVYSFVKIKDENEPLNTNMMATLISDGRFFRYEMFKGFLTSMFDAGYDSSIDPSRIGRIITETLVFDSNNKLDEANSTFPIRDAYVDYLKTKEGYSDQMAAQSLDSKISFRQVLSQAAAENEYNRVIEKISKI